MLKKVFQKNLEVSPKVTGIVVALAFAILSVLMTWFSFDNTKRSAALDAKSIRVLVQQSVNHALTQCYNATVTLAMSIDEGGQVHHFDSIAKLIMARNPNLDALQLVPGGIIQYTYPLSGNEASIGYDILHDPKVKEEALESIRRNDFYFAGPFELKQGGMAVVGRMPIFRNGTFWGFSAVIIRLNNLLNSIGLVSGTQEDYFFRFSKTNPLTNEIEEFLPPIPELVFKVTESYYFESGDWQLMVIKPIKADILIGILFIFLFGIGFSVLSGNYVKNLLLKRRDLQEKLKLKSTELNTSEQRKKAILQALPDLIFIIDNQGIIKDYHFSSFLQPILPPEQFLNRSILEVIPPSIAQVAIEKINRVLTHDVLEMQEYTIGGQSFEARYTKSNANEALIIIRDMTERANYINAIEHQNIKLKEIAWVQSHEVRAPLARLLGLVAWLEENYGRDKEIEKVMFNNIISSAKELDEIIRVIVKKASTIKVESHEAVI